MADKPAPATKVVTEEVRLSYVHVLEPFAQDEDDTPKYSCVILIPKTAKATLKKIKRAQEAAAKIGVSSKWNGTMPKKVEYTLKDGDEDADLENNPEYGGHMYMSVSSKKKPGVVDRGLNPILDVDEVYSGCYARVSLNAFPYNYKGKKGVSFGLNHVQKLRDGENLSGRSRAEDDFDVVDDDDFDDEDLL